MKRWDRSSLAIFLLAVGVVLPGIAFEPAKPAPGNRDPGDNATRFSVTLDTPGGAAEKIPFSGFSSSLSN